MVDENVLSEFSAKHEDAAGRGDTNRNGSGGATAAGTKKELARAKAKLRALLDTPVPDANNGLSGYGVNALTATSAHVKAMGMRPTKTKLKREANVEQSWKKRSSFFVYNPSL